MKSLAYFAVAMLTCVSLSGQGRNVQLGEVIPDMHAAAKPGHTYVLYLPSAYSAERAWPVVYIFDPGAHGKVPVELMKSAAERYGYILAASNNSRNGPWDAQFEAATAVWDDTHGSLSIDDKRVYFAGFSGGARVSAQLAQGCKCAHGVFLDGAGYGVSSTPAAKENFAVFSLPGMGDFNYGELLRLDAQLESMGRRHFLQRFDGEHAWAPAETWNQAFSWAALLEMQDGSRPRDDAFIASELDSAMKRLSVREAGGQFYFALQEARALAATFSGLAAIDALKQKIAILEKNPAVRTQARQEQAELERQRRLVSSVLEITDRLKTSRDDVRNMRPQAMTLVAGMQRDLASEKTPEARRALQRSLGEVFIAMMEGSGPLMDNGDYRSAEFYFQLAAVARPAWAWPHLRLAACHAALGDRKGVLRDLGKAHELGAAPEELSSLVKGNPKLAAMVDDDQLKAVLAGDSSAKN